MRGRRASRWTGSEAWALDGPAITMSPMPSLPTFAELVSEPDPPLDVLTLALAAEFRDDVDAHGALGALDALGAELAEGAAQAGRGPCRARLVAAVLGEEHGFIGEQERYDDPDNSMLDLVLERRRGLPILLSVVYIEVARRAGIPLVGVGLPGHFVVGLFGGERPVLLDPFAGGESIEADVSPELVRPWTAPEIAMRMLNNLASAYRRRGDLGSAIRAASMRLALPAESHVREALQVELRSMQARLN